MNRTRSYECRHALRLMAATLLLATVITGCADSGVGTGGTGSFISGKVADGYLVNATVFMDKNGNYLPDAGEPVATTDQNGSYTLTIDPADVRKYPIVAIATKGITIDKDTNQPVVNSYILSMPKEAVSDAAAQNFISPITAEVREMMETGLYATMQQAMDALRTKMGLPPGTDMLSDYMAANNLAMQTSAHNMATLMGNQMGIVFVASGSTTIVDVNRYRGMMGTIFSNMPSITGAMDQTSMSTLTTTISTTMSGMPATNTGQPYRNMSSSFGGMMGSK